MRSPPITPCSILLLVPFLLLLLSLPLTSAQENTTCVDGYNATCCPCITSGPIICSDPAPIDSLSECVDYHPEGWACCVGEVSSAQLSSWDSVLFSMDRLLMYWPYELGRRQLGLHRCEFYH